MSMNKQKVLAIGLILALLPIALSAQNIGGQVKRPEKKQKNSNKKSRTRSVGTIIQIDGMKFCVWDNGEASLEKGKSSAYLVIPQTVLYKGKRYPVTEISSSSFSGIDTEPITSLYIPDGVKSIRGAFYNLKNLNSIDIPASVSEIDESTFMGCDKLSKITVNTNNKIFTSNNCNAIIKKATGELLKGCSNTIIPHGITSIGKYAFQNCGFSEIILPADLKTIGDFAFENCKNLKTIIFPQTLDSIGYGAFENCSNITSISFPLSLKKMGSFCFECTSVKEITIPANLQKIWINPFASCKYLTRIVVDNENMNYDSRYNCNAIIEKRSSALISGCRKTEIPSDIIKIASHAFGNGDIGYKMNSFPSSLKIIGGFNYIESDSDTLKIPPTIEEIYGDAFWQTIKVVYVPFSCSLKTSGGLKSFYPDTKIIRY